MQAPPPPAASAAQNPPAPSPYLPAAGFQTSPLSYSFHRWLMLGVILILASVVFVEVVEMFGPPSVVDYDLEAEGVTERIAADTEAHNDLNRVIGSVGTILQSFGLGLIGYAMLRESYDEKYDHTALRVTAVIIGVLVLLNVASRSISIV